MNYFKKLFSVLLIIALVFAMTISTTAAEAVVSINSIEESELEVGGILTLTVSLADCERAMSMSIVIDYDEAVLELLQFDESEEPYTEWTGSNLVMSDYDFENNQGVAGASADKNLNGDIFKAVFKVLSRTDTTVDCSLVVRTRAGVDVVNETVTSTITFAGAECTHVWKIDDNKQYLADGATCTSNAKYYKVCDECGIYSDTETFEVENTALGHNWVEDTEKKELATSATCEADATYYKVCDECGTYSDTETFEVENTALGHNWVEDIEKKELATSATCEADATYYKVCDECGTYSDTETFIVEGTALGHDWPSGWTYDKNDDQQHHKTCGRTDCTETQSADHTPGSYDAEDGNDEQHYQLCSECNGKVYSDHNWVEKSVIKEPTCTNGEVEYMCSDCSKIKTEETPATGEHDWGDWSSVNELTHRRECDDCTEFETENHNVENGISLGLTENHKHSGECTVCDNDEAQEACVWDEGEETTLATCCEGGEMLYTCTSGCTGTKTEDISATGNHVWGECVDNEDGTHTHTCKNGTATQTFDHTWDEDEEVTPATCYNEGVMRYRCTACGATKTEDIKMLSHKYNKPTSDGSDTHTAYCVNFEHCNSYVTENHEFDNGEVTTAPSCYEAGVKTFTCVDCDHSYTELVDPTGEHVLGGWVNSDDGITHTRRCITEGCPKSETHNYAITPSYNNIGHWYMCADGCSEINGYEQHTFSGNVCTECGYTKPANQVVSGYIYVNEDYHMMMLTNGIIVSNHVFDENDICVYCLGHVPSDENDDVIEIVDPVEPSTEEEETDIVPEVSEPEVNPETGLTFGTLALAMASLVVALSKKR